MAKKFKRTLALTMVLCMLTSVLPMQVLAADSETTTETVTDGGLTTEITTTTTTTTDEETGNVTVTVEIQQNTSGETEDGAIIESESSDVSTTVSDSEGTNVESSSISKSKSIVSSIDAEGNSVTVQTEQMSESNEAANGETYDYEETQTTTTVINEDGVQTTLEVEEGSETTVEVVPSDDEIPVDVIVDGVVQEGASGSSNTAGTTVTGDLQEDDPENFDQTTVTTTDRTADVTVENIDVTTGIPVYVDENGNIVGNTDDGYNYYWNDIYTTDGKSIIDGEASNWTTGRVTGYIVDEDGNKVEIHREGVCQRVVAHDNGTPDDPSDDYEIGGLYCVDASTGIKEYLKYRRGNLEDATYYSEDDIAHLRGIMTYGYTWDDDDDNGYTNLSEMKAMLKDAQENGDEATKELLKNIDFDKLTREQAATATGMAIWTYGNRYVLEAGQHVEYVTRNETTENACRIEAVYKYLSTLTMEEAEETQIINEEKFIDSLDMSIGGMVDNHEANSDADDTNDVYNVDLKFSLVVQPSANGDDLIVKVVDSEGNVVKTARIAGDQKEGESFGYAKTETDENGKVYYLLEGIELTENANTSFNLKLEGTQMLKEGIYIFESQHLNREEFVHQVLEQKKANGELEELLNEFGSIEAVKEYLATKYTKEAYESQNFIGKYEGTAEIGVSMQIDLTFNVEESVVTTEHVWRNESDPVVTPPEQLYDGPVPMVFRLNNQNAQGNLQEIEEEPVPLASPAITGDGSVLWIALILLSAFGIAAVNLQDKKRRSETF